MMNDQIIHDYVVYILRCADGSLYVGLTGDLQNRLHQHATGFFQGAYTARRRPVMLVYASHFGDVLEAITFERRVKRWSHAKKEALIRGDLEGLQRLAACANDSHHQNILIDLIEKTTRNNLRYVTLSGVEGRHTGVMVRPSTPLGMTSSPWHSDTSG
jgi:putative endonuclease